MSYGGTNVDAKFGLYGDAYVWPIYGGLEAQACTYTYSEWGACQPDGTQTRTVLTSLPAGCTGTPVLSQSCGILSISPSSCDFGTVTVGSCSGTSQQFTLSNIGGADINVSNISLSDTNFTLLLNGGSNPCNVNDPTITPGSSCTISAMFCPSIAGSFSANLEISSNDYNRNIIDISVTGSGILQTKGQTASGRLVVVDGIQILSILDPSYPNDYSHYLLDAIMNDGNWPHIIQQRIGPLTPFVWSRTFSSEDGYVFALSGLLEQYSNDNKKTGDKLIVLAHSWGTVLAYVAISTNSNIQVDKFVSLGSPLNAQNDIVRSITTSDIAGWKIDGSPLQVRHPSNVAVWDNFWEKCDPISGSIPAANNNYTYRTNYYDPETAYQTCHSAYYGDQIIWTSILVDVVAKPRK
jgi:HYDIN/CFA65/VesB-like, Ig-like domain